MGVLYSAIPIDSKIRRWLISAGVPVSDRDGQAPTLRQIQAAIATLDDQAVSYSSGDDHWQAAIDDPQPPETGPWTILNVHGVTSPDEPCNFYFEKGWPSLIIKVVHRIAQRCGPLCVVPDTGCPPVVVAADSDIHEIIRTWEHITG